MVLVGLVCAMTFHGCEPVQGLLGQNRMQHAQDLHTLSQNALHDAQLQRQQAAHGDLPGEAHAQAPRHPVMRIRPRQGVPLLLSCSTHMAF